MQPDKACLYIVACVILHNIAKMLDEVDFEGGDDEDFDCEPVGFLMEKLCETIFLIYTFLLEVTGQERRNLWKNCFMSNY